MAPRPVLGSVDPVTGAEYGTAWQRAVPGNLPIAVEEIPDCQAPFVGA